MQPDWRYLAFSPTTRNLIVEAKGSSLCGMTSKPRTTATALLQGLALAAGGDGWDAFPADGWGGWPRR